MGSLAQSNQWRFCSRYAKNQFVPPPPKPIKGRTFFGYKRPDGKAGTRNYIAVISTVNCSATVSKYIAQRFDRAACETFRTSTASLQSNMAVAAAFNIRGCSTRSSIGPWPEWPAIRTSAAICSSASAANKRRARHHRRRRPMGSDRSLGCLHRSAGAGRAHAWCRLPGRTASRWYLVQAHGQRLSEAINDQRASSRNSRR